MSQGLRLRLDLSMGFPTRVNLIAGLSPRELEELLEESLTSVQEHTQTNENRAGNGNGNYYTTSKFSHLVKKIKQKPHSKEDYLSDPQIIATNGESGLNVSYNTVLSERIKGVLEKFKRSPGEKPPVEAIFSKRFANDMEWAQKKQVQITQELLQRQAHYLKTSNPFNMQPLSQEDLAAPIGCHSATISKLVRNLVIQLPDNKRIFASDLIPGSGLSGQRGIYALRELQKDSSYYENGKWKLSCGELKRIFLGKYSLDVARRTVSKYMQALRA